jgi:hypothetical protein
MEISMNISRLQAHRWIAVVAVLLVAGCQNKSAPQSGRWFKNNDDTLTAQGPAIPAKPPASAVDDKPAPALAGPTSPEVKLSTPGLVQQRVSNYVQEIGPLADNRNAPGPTSQPTQGFNVAGSRGTPTPTAPPQVAMISHPVVEQQQSTANQGLALQPDDNKVAAQSSLRVAPEDINRPVTPAKPTLPGADLEARLAKNLQGSPTDLWAHLDWQLLQFIRDEQVPQLDVMSSLPLEDREVISTIMDGLTNFRSSLRADNNMLLSKKIKPLLELADRLRSQADLNIPALALCKSVEGFGMYEPMEPARFAAGSTHEAILYCEVENFACVLQADKQRWETRLSQEATLYTESGMPVWVDKSGQIVDSSRNRRHDFFLVKRIKLPATLTIGRYLLKVTVEDQQAKRLAEQTVPVEIVAQLDNATPAAQQQSDAKP